MKSAWVFSSLLVAWGSLLDPSSGAEPQPAGRATSLAKIDERMSELVRAKEVSGAVTLVGRANGIAHLGAVGKADIAQDKPMEADTIFWIASMTKPITGTAVLMMQDEGKLSVDDPVSKYLPELADLKLASGQPARITIRHLLTHTSGMGEIGADEAKTCATLADAVKLYASKPVAFEPGTKWAYCQSGINTAGRIVEVVSGLAFPEFLEKRLFAPLGMKDTTFYLTEEQLPRLVKAYRKSSDGQLAETENFILLGKSPTSRDRFPAANGGLFSTASDYAKFCQMILNGGTLDGKQYLKPASVELMTSVQTGDLTTGFTPGNGWGLGWCVVRSPQGVSSTLSPGACGHGGAYGTQAWIDRKQGLIYLLLVQRADFPNSDASDVRRGFQEAAAEEVKK